MSMKDKALQVKQDFDDVYEAGKEATYVDLLYGKVRWDYFCYKGYNLDVIKKIKIPTSIDRGLPSYSYEKCNYMFAEATALTNADLENFVLQTENMKIALCEFMFQNCKSLTSAPDIAIKGHLIEIDSMFSGCTALESVPESYSDLDIYKASRVFYGCTKLTSVPPLNWGEKCLSMSGLFNGCTALVNVPQIDMAANRTVDSMFYNCSKITTIPQYNTSEVETFYRTFYGCSALTTLPALDSSKSTSFYQTYYNCKKLTTIEGIDFSAATNVNQTFYNCSALVNLTVVGTIKITGLTFTQSTQLSHDSLMSIYNALEDKSSVGGTWKLVIGSTNLAKLTDEEKEIAINKGWTVT